MKGCGIGIHKWTNWSDPCENTQQRACLRCNIRQGRIVNLEIKDYLLLSQPFDAKKVRELIEKLCKLEFAFGKIVGDATNNLSHTYDIAIRRNKNLLLAALHLETES